MYNEYRGVGKDDELESETDSAPTSESEDEAEDPDAVVYQPGKALRYVWLGVERYWDN